MDSDRPRAIDHLVLPIESLQTSRERLEALGFTVARQADHPFGTSNACVFLADGTYLEPLVIRDASLVGESVRGGNVFTGRDARFRGGRLEGLSAIVVSSTDAAADHERFLRAGISAGDMLGFSRQALTAEGAPVTASFQLTFADLGSDLFFLFSCQRINPLPADRSVLERHENGVVALREVLLHGAAPDDLVKRIETVTHAAGFSEADETAFTLANARIRLVAGAETASGADRAVKAAAVVFHVADLTVTELLLADNHLPYVRTPHRITVAPAPGQGVSFVFEE
ncbi:VOC family protein [Rhizobium sp. SAFR-030]|uniref:VOC family protein n=1 Tax=Rhizobium sp. SAFR-030 TaxID=3387277 RepID=UPI003F7E1C28